MFLIFKLTKCHVCKWSPQPISAKVCQHKHNEHIQHLLLNVFLNPLWAGRRNNLHKNVFTYFITVLIPECFGCKSNIILKGTVGKHFSFRTFFRVLKVFYHWEIPHSQEEMDGLQTTFWTSFKPRIAYIWHQDLRTLEQLCVHVPTGNLISSIFNNCIFEHAWSK